MRCEMQAEGWEGLRRWRRTRAHVHKRSVKGGGTRERQVGSTLAAEAQAISATCAASRTPARAIGEGRGARPRATDEPLVGVGQGSALPSRKEGIRGGACGAGREARGCGAALAQAACIGTARLKAGGQGTRGAHVEHPAHVRDAGCVEAQRLVERRRILPSRKGGIRCGCGARCGPGGERALGGGGASGMHGKGLAQG